MMHDADYVAWDWWESRIGEGSPLAQALEAWAAPGDPSKKEAQHMALVALFWDLAQAVSDRYPTDLCGACGR
jgi:hypothetical protein